MKKSQIYLIALIVILIVVILLMKKNFFRFGKTDSAVDTLDSAVTNNEEAENVYKQRVGRKHFTCPKILKYGKKDGTKLICQHPNFKLSSGCVVYSFGIANDFSFDDEIVERYGCKVFAFDPSMGAKNHVRGKQIHFYNTGVWGTDMDDYVPHLDKYVKKHQVWKVRTIGTLFKTLGHSGKTIDILKLDVEGAEFPALIEALHSGSLKRVKQLLVEFHVFARDRPTLLQKLRLINELHKAGFHAFYTDENTTFCRPPSCLFVNNINYVNSNFIR